MTVDPWTVATIVGIALMTVVTRAFFFVSKRTWTLPHWAERGLQYAPVAALAAVVAPEVLANGGHFLTTWRDARLAGALAGIAWYGWRRGLLGTIVAGMAVYLPVHIGLGW